MYHINNSVICAPVKSAFFQKKCYILICSCQFGLKRHLSMNVQQMWTFLISPFVCFCFCSSLFFMNLCMPIKVRCFKKTQQFQYDCLDSGCFVRDQMWIRSWTTYKNASDLIWYEFFHSVKNQIWLTLGKYQNWAGNVNIALVVLGYCLSQLSTTWNCWSFWHFTH